MKKLKRVLLLLATFILTFNSFAQKQPDWKEMSDFHAVMSKTFHPTEDGNFQPVKENAASLVAKAIAWQKATVPQGYNKDITAPVLANLVEACKTLEKAVKDKQPNDVLRRYINNAHDVFHEIKEKCSKPANDEGH